MSRTKTCREVLIERLGRRFPTAKITVGACLGPGKYGLNGHAEPCCRIRFDGVLLRTTACEMPFNDMHIYQYRVKEPAEEFADVVEYDLIDELFKDLGWQRKTAIVNRGAGARVEYV